MTNNNTKGGKVRFIRVNGRVVPIKDKDPSKAQRMKNYKKYGDGANQGSRIDSKYEKKARGTKKAKLFTAGTLAGVATATAGSFFKKKSLLIGGLGGATVSAFLHNREFKKNRKKLAKSREREYVRTLGTTSDGNRPSRSKTSI